MIGHSSAPANDALGRSQHTVCNLQNRSGIYAPVPHLLAAARAFNELAASSNDVDEQRRLSGEAGRCLDLSVRHVLRVSRARRRAALAKHRARAAEIRGAIPELARRGFFAGLSPLECAIFSDLISDNPRVLP